MQLKMDFSSPTIMNSIVFDDKSGVLGLDTSHRITPSTCHVSVKYHFSREHFVEGKGVIIQRLESKDHKANFFTNGLTVETF